MSKYENIPDQIYRQALAFKSTQLAYWHIFPPNMLNRKGQIGDVKCICHMQSQKLNKNTKLNHEEKHKIAGYRTSYDKDNKSGYYDWITPELMEPLNEKLRQDIQLTSEEMETWIKGRQMYINFFELEEFFKKTVY